jgi:glucose-1-phosphate cytidylyltransferase
MKVVILAGGFGTRLSEYTRLIPKPMVIVGGKPILYHIMKHYYNYGFKEFLIASGYKKKIIKDFFDKNKFKWKVKVIDTGQKTMTGGRIKRLEKFLNKEDFLVTYGDGLSNVNLKKLVSFHKKNKKIVTLTAVRPPARFGTIKISSKFVKYFKEKSSIDEGWINGGFFVMSPKIFDYIKSDNTYLERKPFEELSKKKQLLAFKHKGKWFCMDTKRDRDNLNNLFKLKKIVF